MARTDIPVVQATPSGAAGPTVNGDTLNGHILTLGEECILHVYNDDSVIHYVTVYIPVLVEGSPVADLVIPINAMENLWMSGWFENDFPTGYLTFDVDSTSLKINAVKA